MRESNGFPEDELTSQDSIQQSAATLKTDLPLRKDLPPFQKLLFTSLASIVLFHSWRRVTPRQFYFKQNFGDNIKNTTINLIGLAVLVVFLTFPRHAMAVDQWNFLQLTCIPEFSYFSLRTVHVEHNYDGTPPYQKLATQKGLYSPEALSKKSYECKSAKRTISVELVDYIPPHETGMCAASPSFSVLIRNDGQEVNKFDADLCHGNAQFVEIFNSHHVHCVMPASPSKGDNVMSCERFEIGLNARNPEDGRTFA